ncbi:glycosyltransferase family 4 protein [Flavobacterium sp. 1355]|uniref:glycosyltransferase family 4 protein n=1 Tax=Flavobacterium sp. 1355 TaxID=2806571 RepID=UPI001AE58B78|nr:glycosyltransferase family 4 protein [Flavobacterium sp. 1355]MBP1224030.1 glycosyltransferase involved in cell wall biosynthesis [Flavobacterium sp. 1355]
MKKIIFVTPQIKTGGGNRVFFELANILVNDYEVKIIYPNNSEETNTFFVDDRIKFLPVGKFEHNKIGKLRNVINTFLYLNKYEKKSYVITSDPIMSIFGFLLNVKKKYRFIQADDYNIFNDKMIIKKNFMLWIYKVLTKFSYKYNYSFIFNSRYSYDRFSVHNLKFKQEPFIVHPALNHVVFNTSNKQFSKKNKKQLCLVARKHPLKGLQTFIDAWSGISDTLKEKVDKIVLISHDDLSDYNIKDFDIVRPKSDEDIVKVYLESDIFISTSLSEGFGLPPLEAMACGCGVITSDSGGINEFAVGDVNCLKFPPKDYKALQKELEILLNDNEKLNYLQKNAIDTAKLFNWDSSAKKIAQILN